MLNWLLSTVMGSHTEKARTNTHKHQTHISQWWQQRAPKSVMISGNGQCHTGEMFIQIPCLRRKRNFPNHVRKWWVENTSYESCKEWIWRSGLKKAWSDGKHIDFSMLQRRQYWNESSIIVWSEPFIDLLKSYLVDSTKSVLALSYCLCQIIPLFRLYFEPNPLLLSKLLSFSRTNWLPKDNYSACCLKILLNVP